MSKKFPFYRRIVEPQLDAMADTSDRETSDRRNACLVRGNVRPTHLLTFVSQIIISI